MVILCVFFVGPILDQVQKDVLFSQRAAYAGGTLRNLELQWRTFILFCLFFKLRILPASLQTVCAYAQFLSRTFKAVSSIRNYLNGVKVLHVLSGFEFKHLECMQCRLLLKGISRLKMHHVKRATPVTPHVLSAIFSFLDFSSTLHVACWAAFLIGFFTMSRKSSLVPPSLPKFDYRKHLCRNNIVLGKHGLIVSFTWSKTNQDGRRHVLIPLTRIHNSCLCPVRAYERLISRVDISELQPAFTFSVKPLKCVTAFRFIRVFRDLLQKAGFSPSAFSGHSFRRGGATFAFQAQVPGELIKLQGDWASEAYLQYLDFSLEEKLSVTLAMQRLINQLN